jgi:hypothetical protein
MASFCYVVIVKMIWINISKFFVICFVVSGVLCLQGCPYIAHDSSDAPELVTAEDIQGCYYNEQMEEDTYVDRDLPSVEPNMQRGRVKRFDKLLCKKVCFEGDSAFVNIRAFALTYDTTGRYVEDTIRYTLEKDEVVYDAVGENGTVTHRYWSSDETAYENKFPLSFEELAVDGVLWFNAALEFPTYIHLDQPGYYIGKFEMSVSSFAHKALFSKEKGHKAFEIVDSYGPIEVYSTKGWEKCAGF